MTHESNKEKLVLRGDTKWMGNIRLGALYSTATHGGRHSSVHL